jgi:hypothetical protein
MNTLYFLNGPPRTAKTTIMKSLVAKTNVQLVAGDALEHGLRNVLIGQPHQMLRGIDIHGTAEHKASFTEGGDRRPFSNAGTESDFLLQFIVGMLDYYRRNNESAAFEGTECSPEWVSKLNASDHIVKAAFVGYTNPSHINSILAYAKHNEHDWINDWLSDESGDETKIRNWVNEQAEICKKLESEATTYGYPFFDISTQPFEDYKSSVLDYFLQS